MDKGNKVGAIVGSVFTAGVTGLLLWLHLGAKTEVPVVAQPMNAPPIKLCDGAPNWVQKHLQEGRAWWLQRGASLGKVEQGRCSQLCPLEGGRLVPCSPGFITVDLRDSQMDETHAGETLLSVSGGRIVWATILVPQSIYPPQVEDDDGSRLATLPDDIRALVLTHELGHAVGYGHSRTAVVGGAVAHKTGELMNPSLVDLGWGAKGLPK